MTDNGTLRDHLADVINERNELLRKVELLETCIDELKITIASTALGNAMMKLDND